MPRITALDTSIALSLQAGGPDANGQTPERAVSDGGNPCRHCLCFIPRGAEMLIFAHRPFPEAQPYAETGPVFLCAGPCKQYSGTETPEALAQPPEFLIKGYSADNRIVYGTGAIVPQTRMLDCSEQIFTDQQVAYVHIRSARNNCYLARIDRS